MKENDKSRTRKIRNLILLLTLTGLILGVSTYAWFIGMNTVNVSSFDVEIASTEDLLLSLNGEIWSTSVSIDKSNYNKLEAEVTQGDDYVYAGHKNWWTSENGEKGLVPVSSIGEMDDVASRLMLYEKASLTPSGGGYRIMASRMNNFTFDDGQATGDEIDPEADGYVAFDLFIKNMTGADYIPNLNPDDEEAIYLDTTSEVTVATSGEKNTGIENSVRIAFAQIGRVIATEDDDEKITAITCSDDPTISSTGICREAQIWEPNDTAHVADAIKYYNTSCKARTAATTYAGACTAITNGTYVPTYAIAKAIGTGTTVDVYDGEKLNTYEDSITSGFLEEVDYFTDSEKIKEGMARPEFMTLAANSITKIRIYIYLEGQDVDNYDWASIGKAISVKFGFTKQRFEEGDFGYEDPIVPTIHMDGDRIMYIPLGGTYDESSFNNIAVDYKDGDISDDIVVGGDTVNTAVRGTYKVTYSVEDSDNNITTVTRYVIVQ